MIARLLRSLTLVVALLALAPPTPVSAQDDTSDLEQLDVLAVSTLDDGRVQVEVAAPVGLTGADLPASAFRVAQEGVDRPVSVQRLDDDELDVVLAIDVSGSMTGGPIESAKAAATAFLRQLPPGARVSLITFGPTADVVQPFTDDLQVVADAVSVLESDGGTALYEGLVLSVEQFPLARTSRRTVVVLSDGADTAETLTIEDAQGAIGSGGIDLFAITLGDADPAALTAIVAEADGGRIVEATNPDSLLAVYDEIGRLLANQYRLIFDPADAVSSSARVFVDHLGVGGVGSFDFTPRATGTAIKSTPIVETAEAGTVRPQPDYRPVTTSWASSSAARLVGVSMLGVALMLAGVFLFNAAPSAVSLAKARADAVSPVDTAEKARDRATGLAERILERRDRGRLVGLALERAGLAVRPAEFLVMVFAVALALAAVGFLFGGPVLALVAAVGTMAAARSWLGLKGGKRSEAFNDQLADTLQLLAGSLRAGHALPQALEAVAREAENPTGDEFHRLSTELRLGRDIEQSMGALADRVQSEDFEWVTRAIAIHREVGGDLAEVLDNINSTIRDRNYIRRQFKALSAEGRYSAYLLLALPFVVVLALVVVSPGYIALLFEDDRGRYLMIAAAASMAVGALWLRSMLKLKF